MKIRLITLGCPKNLVDSEVVAGGLQQMGVQLTQDDNADAMIINTCGFIHSAKEESIETILEAVEWKKRSRERKLFVMGCLTERYGDELQREIPEIDGVFGNRHLQQIVKSIARRLDLRHELLGERQLLTPKHYAYLKISEGCEHPCTFCAIPAIRGRFRSQPMEKLVAEAHRLAEQGVKELILIAQDTTQYGLDVYGEQRLPELLRQLNRVDGIEWIRVMYTYPYHITDAFLDAVAELEHVCNYVDMPVQHVSSRLLKRMARRITAEDQHALIEKMRRRIPNLVLRTSVIVGFPGETEEDFQQLLNYVADGHFDRLGVFTFSAEEGTPAAQYPETVPEEVMRQRQDELIQVQADVMEEKNSRWVGREVRVLVDEFDPELQMYRARTEGDCPEIDQEVFLTQPCQIGSFYRVRITGASAHDLQGEILNKEKQARDPGSAIAIPVGFAGGSGDV